MDDVLGSVIVTERLKTRKSLATNYWEDTISGVEVKSNDRNVKNLWKVLTSFQFCAICHFETTFFNSWKIHVSKNLGGAATFNLLPLSFENSFGYIIITGLLPLRITIIAMITWLNYCLTWLDFIVLVEKIAI